MATLFDLQAVISLDSSKFEKAIAKSIGKAAELEKQETTLANKKKVLEAQLEAEKKKVDDATEAFNKSVKETGAASKETQELAEKLKEAEKSYKGVKDELEQYNDSTEKANKHTGKFAGTLKNGLATAAKIGAAALAAAGTAVVALTKQAVESYAEYEQLIGGVETLFKESADVVAQYAANAYKTAGMSANEYMETVTSFSASLLQSLDGDTAAAAEYADRAITDMADNASKMGSDISTLQAAYAGFAKQNYTLLDNLKLGYGGTKEEMERLIAEANKVKQANGEMADLSIDSYADIVEAIHVVQTEMHISGLTAEEAAAAVASGAMTEEEAFEAMGTTAKEAATTIQGSLNTMKGAWANLLTGLADENADFDALMGNFVDSVVTVGENLMPRIEKTIQGIAKLVSSASKTIIPLAIKTLMKELPNVVRAGADVLIALINGIVDNIDLIVDSALEIITILTDTLLTEEMIFKLVDAGIKLVIGIANGLAQAAPQLAAKIPDLIVTVVEAFASNLPSIVEIGENIVKGIWEGIKAMGAWLWDKVSGFFGDLIDDVEDLLGIHSPSRVFAGIGGNMAKGIGVGWGNEFENIKKDITDGLDFNGDYIATVSLGASGKGRAYGLAAVTESIESLKSTILGMRVVLDSGATVGGIAGKMDSALGKRTADSGRYRL